jgi:hypothetical protein
MQMLDSVLFLTVVMALLAAVSISIYARLPKAVLDCAERHGRFQGLATHETLAEGTPVGNPPAAAGLPLGSTA